MSKNPEKLPACIEDDALPVSIQKLEQVLALIHGRVKNRLSDGDSIAIVRLLEGVSQAEWEEFASRRDLEGWLSIPLHRDLAAALSAFSAGQELLAYQRDHDMLTGLANRRFFYRRLDQEVERAVRSHSELTLMMLDLDNFKQINDTYGHPCGDAVLRRIGHILRHSVRQYDFPGRLGGEEFAVLFPASSSWTGAMTTRRILEEFSAEQFNCDGKNFSMTFSAGITAVSLLEGAVSGEKLISAADQAMYAAKRQGRNRIVVAEGGKRLKDRASLVQSQEKQLLFADPETLEKTHDQE